MLSVYEGIRKRSEEVLNNVKGWINGCIHRLHGHAIV
jgi:hypothetical protein